MGFVGRQIEHEIEATRRLLGCRNVQDVMITYRTVMEDAQRDAQVDIDLLSRINREAATETVAAFREGLSEAAQELRP
jgi:predicted secreted Zn-dependent protease